MTLTEIAEKHGTDKCPALALSYTPFYEELLAGRDVRRLLEIGIWEGQSLRMWAEWLPEAEIWGVDIDPARLVFEGRIRSSACDQGDPAALAHLARSIGVLDVVVDDGSHLAIHQGISANALLPFVAPGGLYIIEDVHRKAIDLVAACLQAPKSGGSYSVRVARFDGPKIGTDDDTLIVIEVLK